MSMENPRHGLVVLEFSQYLAGPSAGLQLADPGAKTMYYFLSLTLST